MSYVRSCIPRRLCTPPPIHHLSASAAARLGLPSHAATCVIEALTRNFGKRCLARENVHTPAPLASAEHCLQEYPCAA